jgi:hypothetical protein
MELICNVCGCIGFGYARDFVAMAIREHIEGRTHPTRPSVAKTYPPHPGHVVHARDERLPATWPFVLAARRRKGKESW